MKEKGLYEIINELKTGDVYTFDRVSTEQIEGKWIVKMVTTGELELVYRVEDTEWTEDLALCVDTLKKRGMSDKTQIERHILIGFRRPDLKKVNESLRSHIQKLEKELAALKSDSKEFREAAESVAQICSAVLNNEDFSQRYVAQKDDADKAMQRFYDARRSIGLLLKL